MEDIANQLMKLYFKRKLFVFNFLTAFLQKFNPNEKFF